MQEDGSCARKEGGFIPRRVFLSYTDGSCRCLEKFTSGLFDHRFPGFNAASFDVSHVLVGLSTFNTSHRSWPVGVTVSRMMGNLVFVAKAGGFLQHPVTLA